MYKSIILPLAKEDIREAAKWYNKMDLVKDLLPKFVKKFILSGRIQNPQMSVMMM